MELLDIERQMVKMIRNDPELAKGLQAHLDELKRNPALSEYVRFRKMRLIDSRYGIFDELLQSGHLK